MHYVHLLYYTAARWSGTLYVACGCATCHCDRSAYMYACRYPPSVTPADIFALHLYTRSELFGEVNRALRDSDAARSWGELALLGLLLAHIL